MSRVTCQFCDIETFQKHLTRHHQTAKCLAKQKSQGINLSTCQCGKSFINEILLNNHKNSCDTILKIIIEEKDTIIEEKDEEIKSITVEKDKIIAEKDKIISNLEIKIECILEEKNLEIKVAKLESALEGKEELFEYANNNTKTNVKTITNNTVNNNIGVMNWNLTYIQEQLQYYTMDHFNDGAKGMCRFIVDRIIKDTEGRLVYGCTDKNRKHFFYINDKNERISDVRGEKLLTMVFEMIKPIALEFKKKEYTRIIDENIGEDQSDDDRIFRLKGEVKKKFDESFSSKVLDNIVPFIYNK